MNESDSRTQDETDEIARLAERADRARVALGFIATPAAAPGTGDALQGVVTKLAIDQARKHQLVDGAGEVYCWNCGVAGALLPSLHCAPCLGEALERNAREQAEERAMHPETKRWRAIFRAMSSDRKLTREQAEAWLRNCAKIESVTPARMGELQRRFDERFAQKQQPAARGWNGKGFRSRPAAPDRWEGMFDER